MKLVSSPSQEDVGESLRKSESHWRWRADRYGAYVERGFSREISPKEDMIRDASEPHQRNRYFNVGRQGLEVVLDALGLVRAEEVGAILDMPCGFGRVIRHFHAFFPEARITACDLYPERVDFCAATFGSIPVYSKENFDEIDFAEPFDVIWVGSLLTHLPEPLFQSAMTLFARSLSPGGIAVMTTHGRYTTKLHTLRKSFLPDAMRGFYGNGFGYQDYRRQTEFHLQAEYGVSLTASWDVLRRIEAIDGVRIVGYRERGWDDHQDVVVMQKADVYAKGEHG